MDNGFEINFDGIVGLTHNYSGLSYGNVASIEHKLAVSSPKQAALQGLTKMKYLADLGIKQGVLPPQERPHIPTLRRIGFTGNEKELLLACCSASSMWAANAATVSPSADSDDGRIHITPANLTSKFHRSIEPPTSLRILKSIFANPNHFLVHDFLPPGTYFSDEGAANHTRFCKNFDERGMELFVYGRGGFVKQETTRYPARQSLEASQAIARLHKLQDNAIFAQQNPKAIDAGVFHNDVISVGHQNVFFYHESAFVDTEAVIKTIDGSFNQICGIPLILIPVTEKQVSLPEAVATYLFNSQLVTLPNHTMQLIAPSECEQNPNVRSVIDSVIANPENPISSVCYFDLHQSMRNGGGPACLRLRVALNQKELDALNPSVLLTDKLYNQLVKWVEKHYRDRLSPSDLSDPALVEECKKALDEITTLLKLGSIYDFQI